MIHGAKGRSNRDQQMEDQAAYRKRTTEDRLLADRCRNRETGDRLLDFLLGRVTDRK